MQYLLLICDVETEQRKPGDPDFQQIMGEYQAFTEDVRKRGALRASAKLRPTTEARTVRVRAGKALTSDGPFAETKEQVGGFYLLECKDLDEAVAYAAKIPTAKTGSVEVRPLFG